MAHADPRVHTEITEIGIRVFKDEIVLPKFFILARNRLRIGSRGHGKPSHTGVGRDSVNRRLLLLSRGPSSKVGVSEWGDTWMQILTSFFTMLLKKNLQLEDTETPSVPVTNPL
jgi:hypothetical protein